MKGIASSLVLVALVILALWALGALFGFDLALGPSLLLSVGLTLLLSLVLRGLRTRRRSP